MFSWQVMTMMSLMVMKKKIYILWLLFQDELDIEAVSVGAILSDYQRVRVENV